MGNILVLGNNAFLSALKNMLYRKEITIEQYGESLRRAKATESLG